MLFLHNICLQIEVDVYVHNEFFDIFQIVEEKNGGS